MAAESPHYRSHFYVGGRYIDDGRGKGQRIHVGQVYVEKLVPAITAMSTTDHGGLRKKMLSVVFIHGGGQTGTNFLNTPDNRPGWSSYFLQAGYTVYLVDTACRGRSPYHSSFGDQIMYPAEIAEQRWTGTRFHGLWEQAVLHRQWPGGTSSSGSNKKASGGEAEEEGGEGGGRGEVEAGKVGNPVFDAYYKSLVPSLKDFRKEQELMRDAGRDFFNHLLREHENTSTGTAAGREGDRDEQQDGIILLGHSQGCVHAWIWADIAPAGVIKAVVAVEPSGPPFRNSFTKEANSKPFGLTDLAITYFPPVNDSETRSKEQEQQPNQQQQQKKRLPLDTQEILTSSANETYTLQIEPARKLTNIARSPVLVVTGEASSHASYDRFTVEYLQQAGVDAEHMKLEDKGVHGNGHLLFMELNSAEIFGLVEAWIAAR